MSALTTAGLIAAGCKPKEEPTKAAAPTATKKVEPTATPKPAKVEEVTLEISASNPEYENAERQIWDIYEAENPHIKIQLFSVNEDTQDAFTAKVAGGWTPAMGPTWIYGVDVDKANIDIYLDLTTIDFPWWDRLTHDPKNKVPELYGWNPVAVNVSAPFVFTWEFHKDLMEAAGLDPRKDVKSRDDMLTWLEAGTKWANSTDDVDFFWDQGWHSWVVGNCYDKVMNLAFPDGQQEDMAACWTGEKKFNDSDSPYRHFLEFFKLAYDEGWVPENWWTREWETDMEASYIAKKSVMMLHGPWPWDKMLAQDATAEQLGLPASPPAAGQDTWVQYRGPISWNGGYAMLARVKDLPEWPEIEKAFAWYHSPKVVKMRLEILGVAGLYKMDELLDLTGPQWVGVVKDIAQPGGLWEDVQYTPGAWGETLAGPHYVPGTPAVWDWSSGALVEPWAEMMKGEMTIQELLDWAQENWEKSYDFG